MPEQFDSVYFRGQGALLIGDIDASNNPVALEFVGDLDSAALTPNVQREQVIENVSGSNAVGASWLTASSYNLQLGMRSIKPEHLAKALQGTATAKTASSVTDEAHTVRLGKFSPLANTKVTSVVVTGSGGSPTYVANTDYKVHGDKGLIEWLSGGTVTEGLAVLVDYSYAAQKHVGSSPNNVAKAVVFAGINSANSDKQVRCQIHRVKFDPGTMSLITNQGANAPISGLIELDPSKPAGERFFKYMLED